MIEKALKPYLNKFALAYIDDIIIYSVNVDEHIKHLEKVLNALKEANLHLGISKCEFFKNEI